MRNTQKQVIFTLLIGLFLFTNSVSGQKDAEKKSDVSFPEIEGWEKSDIRTYPSAELGYSIAYQSEEGGTVTIYVYNGGKKKIADGVDDKVVKNEIKQAGSDIESFGASGYYDNVKKIKDDTVTLGGPNGKVKALYSLYTFKVRGEEVDSEIYLFGYRNNFIKIRATRPKSEDGAEAVEFKKLLAEIDELFSQ